MQKRASMTSPFIPNSVLLRNISPSYPGNQYRRNHISGTRGQKALPMAYQAVMLARNGKID